MNLWDAQKNRWNYSNNLILEKPTWYVEMGNIMSYREQILGLKSGDYPNWWTICFGSRISIRVPIDMVRFGQMIFGYLDFEKPLYIYYLSIYLSLCFVCNTGFKNSLAARGSAISNAVRERQWTSKICYYSLEFRCPFFHCQSGTVHLTLRSWLCDNHKPCYTCMVLLMCNGHLRCM